MNMIEYEKLFATPEMQTTAPALGHNVVISLAHVDSVIASEIYSLRERAKASAISNLKDKIAATDQSWEAARIRAVDARAAFNKHRGRELEYQNDVNRTTARMFNANQAVSSLEQTELDPYSSREDRQKHADTIAVYRRTATLAEKESFDANAAQQAYYATAERLRSEYVAANDAFRAVDVELSTLKRSLSSLEAEESNAA